MAIDAPETTADTAEDAAYRAAARAWLAANAPAFYSPPGPPGHEPAALQKGWARRKWEAGYSGIDVPEAAGGAGGTPRQARIFAEEEAAYAVPRSAAHYLVLAALMTFGTPEQIKRWGTSMWSGAGLWTQLFSEPSAGSDLGALRTRAVRRGDDWIVNGQKVWSSYAHRADYGFMVARTDGSVPKHKGLTFFFIDMRQPGVEVRPIRQMTGAADFNEVFFTDAVIPDADRIGAVGQGWAVTMTVLGAERTGGGGTAGFGEGPDSPVSGANLVRAAGKARRGAGVALDSAQVRAQLAQWHVEEQGIANFSRRLREIAAAGGELPPTSPVVKLTSARRIQQALSFLMDLEEYAGVVQDADWPRDDKFYDYLYAPIFRIAGGSDEILRNQLSERALGMPGDIRLDKDRPFDELPF